MRPLRVALLAAIALAAGAPGAQAAAWLPAETLSDPSAQALGVDVGLDATGGSVATWRTTDGVNTRVAVLHSAAAGAPGSPVLVSAAGSNANAPRVAVAADGRAVVAWDQGGAIWAARIAADGAAGAPFAISDTGSAAGVQLGVDAGGDVTAVWGRAVLPNRRVEARRLFADGTMSPVQLLSPAGVDGNGQVLGISTSGEAVAAWRSTTGLNEIIRARRIDASGAPGPVTFDMSLNGQNAAAPRVAIAPDDTAFVVWTRSDGAHDRLQGRRLPPGVVAGPILDLSPAGSRASEPDVAVDAAGAAAIAWIQDVGAEDPVHFRRVDGDGTVSGVLPLTGPGGSARAPRVAVNPAGVTFVVWDRFDGTSNRVQSTQLPPAGVPSPTTTLTATGEDGQTAALAVDAVGNALAAWRRTDQPELIVRAAAFDAQAPVITSFATPPTGIAGQPIGVGLTASDNRSGIASVAWTFGDGGVASGAVASHAYAAPGTYPVGVTVTDGAGNVTSRAASVVVGTAPVPPVVLPPAPPFPAKLEIARATVQRTARRLDVLAPITARASGSVRVRFRAAGRTTQFTAPIDSANRRVRFARAVTRAQARLGTGILTLRYAGDADTQPQEVRLRAAAGRAQLAAGRPTLVGDRLRASGRLSSRARGVVRLQLLYEPPGATTRTIELTARIRGGRYRVDRRLPADVVAGIAARRGVVHSYTLFTGYLPARMRGEMKSFQVLGPR